MTTTVTSNGPLAIFRSSREIREQLADLAKVKATAAAHGTPDFASRLAAQSIARQEQELREELRAAEMLESGSAAELVLDGDPVRDHMVQASFLGAVLSKLQHLVNAFAQVVTSIPTSRAPVPRNVVAENRLMVAGWAPSSFAVRLRLPTREELGQIYDTESQSVIEGVAELLAEQAPSQRTVEWLSHPRVKKHYYEFLEVVAKQGAVVKLRTPRHPFGVAVTARQARERVEWLDLLLVREQPLTITGILVGGSIETGRFEVRADEELYRGRASEIATLQMKGVTLGAEVRARLRVTTMVHEEGVIEPTTSYVLEAIESLRG